MSIYTRNNINIVGSGAKTMLLAHGYGCDQNMWRFVTPAFASEYRIILFDHVGAGKSDLTQYSREKYETLQGYADDLLDIIEATGARRTIFVGHSVSAMIGVLAAISQPQAFQRLILIGPSPCYLNDVDYSGGFERADIESLLETLESNYLGWSSSMAPIIMGNADRPELRAELTESFCRTDPDIAKHFAQVTFLSDNRRDLGRVEVPALILQCSEDVIAPHSVGEFVHRHMAGSKLIALRATGHCPHMSAPEETIGAIRQYLST
ncbi:MAG: alpha/beta hydrolase [Acidobacteriaceae bacterium]|nr:alpha/beta hydrolase [Acidobacteriaceae bacterium]